MRDPPTNHSESEELPRCLRLGAPEAEPATGILVCGNNEGVAPRKGGAREAGQGWAGEVLSREVVSARVWLQPDPTA